MTKNRLTALILVLALAGAGLAFYAGWTIRTSFLGFSESVIRNRLEEHAERVLQSVKQSLQEWNRAGQVITLATLDRDGRTDGIGKLDLQEALMNRPPILALTVFRKSVRKESPWKQEIRASHPALSASYRFPKLLPDADLPNEAGGLRLRIDPAGDRSILSVLGMLERRETYGWNESLVTELDAKEWAKSFAVRNARLQTFVFDASGHLIYVEGPPSFEIGSDISHLPGVRELRSLSPQVMKAGHWVENPMEPGEAPWFGRGIVDPSTGIGVLVQTQSRSDPGLEDTTHRVITRLILPFFLFVGFLFGLMRLALKNPLGK